MLNPSSFKTRTALEDFSIRAANDTPGLIADAIFPPVYVSKEEVKVYQYDTSNLRASDPRKSSKAQADSVDYNVFTTERTAQLHKLQGEFDPADADQFDGAVANLEQDTAAVIMERLMLAKEIEAATLVTTTSNYPASLTRTLTTTWLDTGADPLGDVAIAKAAVRTSAAKVPNAAAMSWTTYERLKSSGTFLDLMKYTVVAPSDDQFKSMLASWLGVQKLAIGTAVKNANVEGNATQTLTDVWGDGILFYVDGPAALRSMSFGKNYMYNQMYTERWEDKTRGGPKGRIQMMEMGLSYVLAPGAVVSSSDTDFAAGYYLANVI